MRLVPWACGLSALVAVAEAALFARNSPVLHLTPNNFDKEVLEVHKPALVAFTAPWCGYCRNLAPSFERVAAELDGVVKIAYVDCDDSASQALCAKYEIKGFPTIKLFPATKRRVPRDYLGERKGKAMMNYVLDALPSEAVRKLDASSLPAFLAKGSTPKIVLVTPMGKTSPMLRSLALDYLKRIPFAHVFAGKDVCKGNAFEIVEGQGAEHRRCLAHRRDEDDFGRRALGEESWERRCIELAHGLGWEGVEHIVHHRLALALAEIVARHAALGRGEQLDRGKALDLVLGT